MTSMIDNLELYDLTLLVLSSYLYTSIYQFIVGIFVEYADTKEPLKTVKVEVSEQQKKSRYTPIDLYRST